MDRVFLVSGLPGSGRSHLLAAWAAAERARGRRVTTSPSEASADSVLIFDDADRAAPAERDALRALVERGEPVRAVLALSSWPGGAAAEWAAMLRPAGVVERCVPRVPDAELRGLASDLGGDAVEVDDVSGAGGHPGLVAAVAHVAAREGLTRLSDVPASGRVREGDVPLLAALDRETSDVLYVAALCGDAVEVRRTAHGLGLTPAETLRALVAAERAGILEPGAESWRFGHAWLADILIAGRTAAEARSRHSLIAEGLLAEGGDPLAITHHLLASDDRSTSAVSWLIEEATQRISEDPLSAVQILETLMATAPPRFALREQARRVLARALAAAGRAPDVERLVESALADGGGKSESIPLLIHLSEALLLGDDVRKSVDVLAAAATASGAAHEHDRLMAVRSFHRVLAGELQAGESEAEEARRRGQASGDDVGESIALSALAHVAYYRGDIRTATRLADEAVRHADRGDSDEARRRSRYELGMFLIHADEPDRAAAVFERERERSDGNSASWHLPLPHVGLGLLAFHRGRWDEATARLSDALRFGEQVSTRWESWAARAHLAAMAIDRGRLDEARVHLDAIELEDANTPHHSLDAVLWARALMADALGQPREAFDLLRRATDLIVDYGVVSRLRWLAPDLVRIARRLDRTRECRDVLPLLDEVASRAQAPYITAAALRTRALHEGDSVLAIRAVEVLRDAYRPVELAATAVDAARLCTETRADAASAAELFREARMIYHDVGAAGRVAALRDEMRAHGFFTLQDRKVRVADGPASLTPAERRVADLVGRGMSNPAIAQTLSISPRTVETHVAHIFTKLGIKSRVELAVRAAGGLVS